MHRQPHRPWKLAMMKMMIMDAYIHNCYFLWLQIYNLIGKPQNLVQFLAKSGRNWFRVAVLRHVCEGRNDD